MISRVTRNTRKKTANRSSRRKPLEDPAGRLDQLLFAMSSAFARMTLDEVDKEISRWLRCFVEVLGLDRASVVQTPRRGQALQVTHTYAVEGVAPSPAIIPESLVAWYREKGRQHRILRLERLPDDLPAEALAERAYAEATGLKSYLAIPLIVSDSLVRGLGFASFRAYRAWPEPTVRRLRAAADLIGGALARKRTHQALEDRLAFERIIADLVKSLVVAIAENLDAEIREGLRRLIALLGVDRCSVARFSDDRSTLSLTHQAARDGVPLTPFIIGYSWYLEGLREGRTFQLGTADLPAEVVAKGMKSHLAIPLMNGDRVWGGIGFGAFREAREWTSDEVQRLRLVGEIMMGALLRRESEIEERKAHADLAERVEFEELLTRLSSAFVSIPADEIDDEIQRWLAQLVEFLRVDRCSILQMPLDERVLHVTHSHAIRGAPPMPTVVSEAELPWYVAQVSERRMVRLEQVPAGLPPEAEAERAHAERSGLKSLLILPFKGDGPTPGAVAFASTASVRDWPDAVVKRLDLVADVFAGALARKRARAALVERLAFERLITDLVKRFVNAPADQLDTQIREGLASLVGHFGVDRTSFFRFAADGTVVLTHQARLTGVASAPDSMRVPWYVQELSQGRIVQLRRIPEDLPSAAAAERERVTKSGIRSHLAIPLSVGGRVWGGIGFGAFFRHRHWTDEEAQRLALVGEIIMQALRRREAEEAARRQHNELAHVARVAALGELTAALAHELNQPLAAIGTSAQAIRRFLAAGRPIDNLDEVLGGITADATRAAELIRRLRNLLRRRELEKVPLDLSDVIRDLQLITETEVRRHGARLVLQLAAGLPRVAGDAVQLQQVVLNLARNAAEAMADNPLEAREVVIRTSALPPETVTVSVEDSGPSIDAAALEKMFAPFHTTKPDGLGMGLAISLSIVEAHGGRLWAEQRPVTGLALQFALPVHQRGGA
jgi:signal transduction histidine kinase